MNSARTWRAHAATIGLALACSACAPGAKPAGEEPALAGAWKSSVQIQTGALAAVKDLEFMYVFNAGGTMTESSNYDAAPPVPPAYGMWRALGAERFEARYEFFVTRPATPAEAAASGGGWLPGGRGVLSERITLAADGRSYASEIRYDLFDPAGKPVAGGGVGTAQARRMAFD
jgi:hypothetical protein